MNAPGLIRTIEAAGGVLTLKGDRIQYELPEDHASMVEVLRQHRAEVIQVLRDRERALADHTTRCSDLEAALEKTIQSGPPPMPEGVSLLEWAPKVAPVAIERWTVVNDVPKFVRATLVQLRAAMEGKNWLAGNWSIRDLVERLEQVGVKVSVEVPR